MIKITQPIIVEGKYDKIKLESIIDALIITTEGFEIFKDSETGYANSDYFSAVGVHLNGDGYRFLLYYAAKHQYN